MPLLHTRDTSFWDDCPEPLQHLQDSTLKVYPAPGHVGFFTMGDIQDNPRFIACLSLARWPDLGAPSARLPSL